MAKRSRLQTDENICYICNRPLLSRNKHHIFNGSMRDKSEDDSMFIYVHPCCHLLIHNDSKLLRRLKTQGQKVWIEDYIQEHECTEEEALLTFMKRYGKSYGTD